AVEDAGGGRERFVARGPALRRPGPLHGVTGVGAGVFLRVLRRAGVGPARVVVGAGSGIVSGEDATVVFGVDVLVVDDRGGIRVGEHVVVEPQIAAQHIVDEPAEEGDVAARPDRHIEIGGGRGAAESRVDVDDGGATFARLHRPAEADRVVLGHVAAHDQDRVGVGQVLLEGGGPTPYEACSQTGNRGALSYSRLVVNGDNGP